MTKTNFLRHVRIVTEAYQACDKICDCLGVNDMDNGLIDLLNDMADVYADVFQNWEDEFYEVFWEVAGCGECSRMNITIAFREKCQIIAFGKEPLLVDN